jgi:hypothetical protein
MKHFVMTISDKGGAGKSAMARLIADYIFVTKVPALLVDGDGEVGQLAKFYAERDENGRIKKQQTPGIGVLQFGLHGQQSDREKIATVLDHGANLVLCDFPAAGLTVLEQLQDSVGLLDDIKAEGYKPVFINPITPFAASMRTVKRMINMGGNDSEYVVVKNNMFADGDDDWIVWNGSEESKIKPSGGKKALAEVGGIEIELPKLRLGAMSLIDEFNLTFEAACNDMRMPRYHRKYAQLWRKSCHETLDQIAEKIGVKK